jgi:hypothetical protein
MITLGKQKDQMKNEISLVILIVSSMSVFSQAGTNTTGITNEFAMLAAHGGSSTSFSTFQTYSNNQVEGTQFFISDWRKGEIVMNNKEVFNNGFMLAFDKVRQEVFIKQENTAEILLGTKEEINRFSIWDAGKQYHFINSSVYSNEKPEVFYQVLVSDPSKITLLKYTKGTFVKADKNDMMKQTQGEVYDSFVDKVTYYISKENGELQPIQLKPKALKKTFSELNVNIDKYLNQHPESVDEDYLISMVMELNR